MNIIVLGPPASGKGTQAELLAKKLKMTYLEMGEILRERAERRSALGKKIDWIMHQKGTLVPDEIIVRVFKEWLVKDGIEKGIIFDGYPRKLSQYKDLEKILSRKGMKIDKVIYLKVSRKTIIKRVTSRRVCPKCDDEYNLLTKPPKKDELCDHCRKKLILREDDRPEVLKRRLIIYRQMTEPLVKHIRNQGILEEVDGERPIEVIHKDIVDRLSLKK